MTRILLVSDIGFQIDHFRKLFAENDCGSFAELTVHCSPGSENELKSISPMVTPLNIKEMEDWIIESFDLIVSYHCRQLFPKKIVQQIKCINIHPGYNPYNRGWYPGVFSISNGLPAGATIHEIDEKIDNGPIIAQKQIEILPEDTSGTVYPKIIQAEYELLEEWFMPMLTGSYETFLPSEKGNLNYKKDYYALQQLNLGEKLTMKQAIDRLRALTHPPFQNAYFLDENTGDRIYVSVNLTTKRTINDELIQHNPPKGSNESFTAKNILVFPCGSEIGLEVHRSLRYSRHFNLIGASSVSDHGEFVYEKYIGTLPFVDDPEFPKELRKVVEAYKLDAIYPAMDSVAYELKKIEPQLGCIVLTSSLTTTEICLSKLKTYNLLEDTVPVPKVYSSVAEIEKYPVFLKPEIGYGSRGVKKALDEHQVIEHLLHADKNILITEYLPGPEYTIDCFTDFKGQLRFAGPRLRGRVSNGISTRTFSIKDERLTTFAHRINDHLSLNGAWFFQVKENSVGEFVLLEVAARLAGSSATYRAKGINFAALNIFNSFKVPVDILENNYEVTLDRALNNRFKLTFEFEHAYVDFDDALIVRDSINIELVKLIYDLLNKGKKIHLITKHAGNLSETLSKFKLQNLFDEIIHLKRDERKSDRINEPNSIFIDDSYAERAEVKSKLGIPVFDLDMIECLI